MKEVDEKQCGATVANRPVDRLGNNKKEHNLKIKKSWVITPAVAFIVGVVGLAVAAEVSDTGTAKATGVTGTLSPVLDGNPNGSAPHGGSIIGDIWPGHANDISIALYNPNTVAVKIDKLVPQAVLIQSGPQAGQTITVDGTGYANGVGTFSTITDGGTVVGKGATGDPTYSNAFTADPNGTISNEQGVTLTVHYAVTFESD